MPDLTDLERRLWRQSEAVLRMGQVREAYTATRKNNGMVLASLPPGEWHSGWVRDAMYEVAKDVYRQSYPLTEFPAAPDESYRQAIVRSALEVAYRELPDPARLVELLRQQLEQATAFRLQVAITTRSDGSWTYVDDRRFQVWRRVTLEAGYPGAIETLVDGYVTHVELMVSAEREPYLELSGMDLSAAMDLAEKQLAWPNKKDHEIAQAIFSSYGLRPDVEDTVATHGEALATILQTETDIRFLRRLAARNGFEDSAVAGPKPKWVGAIRFHQVADALSEGFQRHWDEQARVPWLYHPQKQIWITYDDAESIGEKAAYVRAEGLGGIMIWELSGDNRTLLPVINEQLGIAR